MGSYVKKIQPSRQDPIVAYAWFLTTMLNSFAYIALFWRGMTSRQSRFCVLRGINMRRHLMNPAVTVIVPLSCSSGLPRTQRALSMTRHQR